MSEGVPDGVPSGTAAGRLERHQVWLYLGAIGLGALLALVAPEAGDVLSVALLPLLAVLIYATFTQVPLAHLPSAARDGRFLGTILVANFVLIPAVVWALVQFVPPEDAVRLGVLLVLLVPCTDWFLTFSHLAGGDVARSITVTPYLLILQLVLLPLYLWLFLGETAIAVIGAGQVIGTFAGLIIVPLIAAGITQRLVERAARPPVIAALGKAPIPLLAVVMLVITASELRTVLERVDLLPILLVTFVGFLTISVALGYALGRVVRLPVAQARTVVFSMSTRNSFVVLPIALALPAGAGVAVVVIVVQSLVELIGMIVLVRLVPRLVRERDSVSV